MKLVSGLAAEQSHRMMWITADRVCYIGLLGAPTVRSLGSITIYVSLTGAIRTKIRDHQWQESEIAVVPPYVPHQVSADAREIIGIKVEAESVDLAALPALLNQSGATSNPTFVRHVRGLQQNLSKLDANSALLSSDFDKTFFGASLVPRKLDPRIATVLAHMTRDPSETLSAERCAQIVHLSFSRFLHLFTQEIGISFRKFRTWKRARELLYHANRSGNLAHIALDIGYADSTHFSHSIRQVYGLRPRDILAGSRRLIILGQASGASLSA